MFYSGIRPAINVGLSVSRVGGSAQIKTMKQVAGTLRLDLAQYREMAAFSQFGSELDKTTQAQLARGVRMVELLKQAQYVPYKLSDQIVSIFAGSKGFLDDLPVNQVRAFEVDLLKHVNQEYPEKSQELTTTGELSDDLAEKLSTVIKNYKAQWLAKNKQAAPAKETKGAEKGAKVG